MLLRKVYAVVLLSSFLMGWTPIAKAETQESIGDRFVEIKTGDTATEDGFFFTAEALSKVIAKQDAKLATLGINKDTEIKKLQLDIEVINKKKEIEAQINKEMYEVLLKIKQDRVESLQKETNWGNVKLIGGFTLGVAVSIAIFYAAVQVK